MTGISEHTTKYQGHPEMTSILVYLIKASKATSRKQVLATFQRAAVGSLENPQVAVVHRARLEHVGPELPEEYIGA